MREREIITEAIASEITVGFELEIVVPGARTFSSQIDDLEPGTLEQLAPQIERIVAKYGLGRMDEQSVKPNDDDLDTHFGAEFDIGLIKNTDGHSQTRLTATPPNFTKVAQIVKEFLDNGAYTNETCGFHVHFGLGQLEKTSSMDTTWFTAYFISFTCYFFFHQRNINTKSIITINEYRHSSQFTNCPNSCNKGICSSNYFISLFNT